MCSRHMHTVLHIHHVVVISWILSITLNDSFSCLDAFFLILSKLLGEFPVNWTEKKDENDENILEYKMCMFF